MHLPRWTRLAVAVALIVAPAGANAPAPDVRALLRLDGGAWVKMSLGEKDALIAGFLLGALAAQTAPGGASVAQQASEVLQGGMLRWDGDQAQIRARVDRFYFWAGNAGVPIVEALAAEAGRR